MYIKVCETGADTGGLFCYLYGPGKQNEHTNPHMIAGNETYPMAFRGSLSYADARELAHTFDRGKRLEKSHELHMAGHNGRGGAGRGGIDRERPHVMHVSLSLHPDDKPLTDEQWAIVAREYVEGMFPREHAQAEQDWVAIRHGLSAGGNDHIHVVINRIRTDGTWSGEQYTYLRSRDLARQIERNHPDFLTQLVTQNERSSGTYHRVERERHPSQGRTMLPSQQLARIVRSSAMKAKNESEFLMFLHDQGVSYAPRWGKGGTDEVIGYSVKLRADRDGVWRGGGKLAPDLTLTKLRERWGQDATTQRAAVPVWRKVIEPPKRPEVMPEDAQKAIKDATAFLIEWTKELRATDPQDKQAWKREAGRLAGVFADLGQRTPGQIGTDMRWMARRYERMAQDHARPVPTQRGNAERAARSTDVALSAIAMTKPGSWAALYAVTMQAQIAVERAERSRVRLENAQAENRRAWAEVAEVRARSERIQNAMRVGEARKDDLVKAMQQGRRTPAQHLSSDAFPVPDAVPATPTPERGYGR